MKVRVNYPGASLDSWRQMHNTLCIKTNIEKGSSMRSPRFNFHVEGFFGKTFKLTIDKVDEIIYPKFPSRVTFFISQDCQSWAPVVLTKREEINPSAYEFEFSTEFSDFFLSSYPTFEKQRLDVIMGEVNRKFPNISEVEQVSGKFYLKIFSKGEPRIKNIIICGQHPGEVITYFFILGFLEQLYDFLLYGGNLINIELHIFPYIDFDSYLLGGHRLSEGIDLNRTWHRPYSDLQKKICGLISQNSNIFDVHGDEISNTSYVQEDLVMKHFSPKFLKDLLHLKQRPKLIRTLKKFLLGIKTQNEGMTLSEKALSLKANACLIELSMTSVLPIDADRKSVV